MRGDTSATHAHILSPHKKDTITQTKHYIEKSQQNIKKLIINFNIYKKCPFEGINI